jgi:hypothetical protein
MQSSVIYNCPWANRCACAVRFRVIKSPGEVHLYTSGKHTPESHSQEQTVRGLKLPQKAALAQAVRVQPMAAAADVRRSLNLVDKSRRDEVYISPVKHRSVVREVSKLRTEVLSEFSVGAAVDRTEGNLTRMCDKMFIRNLVVEHNRPDGAHLQLHAPVCVGHQFSNGRTLACFSTPFLLLHAARSVNDGWPLQMNFDSTGGISDSQIDVLGCTVNSLRNHSNPVCLAIANQEDADGYEFMYDSMESGLFQLVGRTNLCASAKSCKMCDAIREQKEQGPMRDGCDHPRGRRGSRSRRRSSSCRSPTPYVTIRQSFPSSSTRNFRISRARSFSAPLTSQVPRFHNFLHNQCHS